MTPWSATAGCAASISTPKPRSACAGAACAPINVPAPVNYLRPEEGGVSHFNYFRDNALLTWMHLRLLAGFVLACRCCWRDKR